MFAALPMYDFPQTRTATDALWAAMRQALRAHGIAAPEELMRGGDLKAQWRDPALLFGQTCGYPYWTGLRGHLEILAAPLYDLDGCEGPNHCSFLVARSDDPRPELAAFRGARAAVNGYDSNTGFNLLRAAVAPFGPAFFGQVVLTGAHSVSLVAVAEGRADLAAIDCVSYGLLRPEGVRIVGRTPPSPALPFVTSRTWPQATRDALREALFALPPQPGLHLGGVTLLPEGAYARVGDIARQSAGDLA
jgi:ABC-type phosphate/phosphonate transport system substrate-binding protein